MESDPTYKTFIPNLHPEEVQELLWMAALKYRYNCIEGIDDHIPTETQIVALAIEENDSGRLDALVRARVLESYASQLHDNELFRDELMSEEAFSAVTANEYSRQVFGELIDLALKDLPPYCERLIRKRYEKRWAWAPDDNPTTEFTPNFDEA